jgi:predicted DsbA family dithiol-disulfide isomerase
MKLKQLFITFLIIEMISCIPKSILAQNTNQQEKTNPKMKIEIWSDVMCPFCYIGKRKIEAALAQFENANDVEIEWKSFQLNPNMVTDPSKNVIEHLSEAKGIPLEQAKAMNVHVTKMAAEHNLNYNLNEAVVANSFKAHRFSHYAKTKGKQLEAEEALFKAYFTDGLNTDDNETLLKIANKIGLEKEETNKVLTSNQFADEVRKDLTEAQQLGISGVPFFVFDRKYAISGAQEASVFENKLSKAYTEWKAAQPQSKLSVTEGAVCKPDGTCD